VSDGETLGTRTLGEDVRRIRRIDEHAGAGLAIAKQIAEVAIAARTNLFEDESHARDSYITTIAWRAARVRMSRADEALYDAKRKGKNASP
jgi:hypothetical protein